MESIHPQYGVYVKGDTPRIAEVLDFLRRSWYNILEGPGAAGEWGR